MLQAIAGSTDSVDDDHTAHHNLDNDNGVDNDSNQNNIDEEEVSKVLLKCSYVTCCM